MKRKIILASWSERRSRILSESGIKHSVVPSGVAERMKPGEHISEIVRNNAVRKAQKVAASNKEAIVIGADTLVAHGSKIIGKPDSKKNAREMLKKFSGSGLEVYTGISVMCAAENKRASGFSKSSLKVTRINAGDIERYFRLLAPYDKAGGFSIEGVGSIIFDDIKGSYFNILGLPMIKLAELFKKIGYDILDYIGRN